MSKRVVAVAIAVAAAIAGVILSSDRGGSAPDYGKYKASTIEEMAENLAFDGANPDMIFDASEENGNLPEKVIGDLDKAEVILYEYADYACSHCAEWSATLDKMVEKSDGKLAVVYRGYIIGFKNSVVVASAATAAQIQGCWQEYKDLLFENQVAWAGLSGKELQDELVSCFEKASDGKGDADKFLADMKSETVAKKIAFEHRLGNEIKLSGTPTFRLDGKNITLGSLKQTVEAKLYKETTQS